jgi:hypothetical protein
MGERFSSRLLIELCRRAAALWSQNVDKVGATDDEFQTRVINDFHHNIFIYTGSPDKYRHPEKESGRDYMINYSSARHEIIEMVNGYSREAFDPAPVIDEAVQYALEGWRTRRESNIR